MTNCNTLFKRKHGGHNLEQNKCNKCQTYYNHALGFSVSVIDHTYNFAPIKCFQLHGHHLPVHFSFNWYMFKICVFLSSYFQIL